MTAARLRQNLETGVDERIEYATWPETVLYFSTSTMDGLYTSRDVKELYQRSFRQYLDRWTSLALEDQPKPISTDPDLTDYQRNRLDDLRFGIKKDRDRYFVDKVYDDLGPEGVPKTFWLTDYERDRNSDGMVDMAQSALTEFTDDGFGTGSWLLPVPVGTHTVLSSFPSSSVTCSPNILSAVR